MQPDASDIQTASTAGLGLLLRLKLSLLRNRVRQLVNDSPLRLLLVMLFVAIIWVALYAIFDSAFVFMRRFPHSAIAVPYVFHIFFVAMMFLLAFSSAVLVYGALFAKAEPSFLMVSPIAPQDIVTLMFLESLFFASWSLLLLGIPLMLAIGQTHGLPWYFYITFIVAFLSFVPIPGALGLLVALVVALWLPRLAKRALFYAGGVVSLLVLVWWGRLWAVGERDSDIWLDGLMAEIQQLKMALLPSTWVSNSIQMAIEGRPADAAFYIAVTLSSALFLSWVAVNLAGRNLLTAFGRAHSIPNRVKAGSGGLSRWMTRLAFFYLPKKMRILILKDVRNFLRDPLQWSQLAILLGLLGLYLAYLPRARPGGFNLPWQALICFLNFGAITLILSTFTSRFVFPLISLEGRQMWLVGLWPMSRSSVMWSKFLYAMAVTTTAAIAVTLLSIRALELPPALGLIQAGGTLATCAGLCGMAVGLGARLPSYKEANSGRVAAGLGGTVNLIASVGLVTVNVGLFGGICYRQVGLESLGRLDLINIGLFIAILVVGLGTAAAAMALGIRSFRSQQF